MLIKTIIIFLLVMVLLAFIGRALRPKPPAPPRTVRPPAPVLCIQCGTPIPGGGACPCGGTHQKG